MLVREHADQAGADATPLDGPDQQERAPRTLAACPDSDDRGEAWRWSVTLVPEDQGWTVQVDTDEKHVRGTRTVHRDGAVVDVSRASGDEIVIVPTAGQALVADATGPWRRWLRPGDVFVGEGETAEDLRLTLAPGQGEVTVVSLSPTGSAALRWVP